MTDVKEQLLHIEERLQKIEEVLRGMQTTLDKMNASCSNMDEHIDFVETVYDTIKRPFGYILPGRIKNVLYIK